jgi:hypothetical protein
MRRRSFLIALAALTVGGMGVGNAVAANRVTTDLPDEQVGPQIHFVYAVPAGGNDRGFDVNETIDGWVGTFNAWLAAQTGGVSLRIDTASGAPDTTFIQLKESDASIESMGMAGTTLIEDEVAADGLNDPFKAYVIVYEGADNFGFCGNAIGNASVVYLESCNVSDWLSMLIGHEIFHLLGAVNTCAPHYGMYGETADNPNDLMAFDVPAEGDAQLDPGHDDYWGPPGDDHLPTACPASANVANSDYPTSHPFATIQVHSTEGGAVALDPANTSDGTCTSDAPCSSFFAVGSQITLSSLPDNGFHLASWGGINCPATQEVCTVDVNGSASISATFAADPYLQLRIKGAGAVRIPDLQQTCTKTLCRYQMPYQLPTRLIAVAKRGSHFTGWSGRCTTRGLQCSVNLTASASLTATFARNRPVRHH